MSEKSHPTPTESELEILQLLWLHGPSTVRDINKILNEKREVGYTTTLKIMQIMAEKNLVTRNTEARTHIYHAAVKEKVTQNSLLNKFIEKTYRGSAMRLVMQVLGQQNTTQEELEEIKKMITSIEEKESK